MFTISAAVGYHPHGQEPNGKFDSVPGARKSYQSLPPSDSNEVIPGYLLGRVSLLQGAHCV